MESKQDSFFMQKKKQKNDKSKPKDLPQANKEKRNQEFDKNRTDVTEVNDKKPFDKKTYRLKKYSKKYKLEQWEDQRKKKVMREYYKDIQNDPMAGTYKPINYDELDGTEHIGKYVRHPDFKKETDQTPTSNGANGPNKAKDPYSKAKERLQQIKQDKINKRLEIEKAKQERDQKLLEYKKKKQERFKKLSKKTKKGQPVMTGRLELLLEKIQNNK